MSTATLPDDPKLRARFGELKPALSPQAAVIEADRVLNCFDAPCTAACPTHMMCRDSSSEIASGKFARVGAPHFGRQHLGASWRACVPGRRAV